MKPDDLKKEIGTINFQAHALAAALDAIDAAMQSVSETEQSVGITEQSLPKVSNDPTTWPVWTVVWWNREQDVVGVDCERAPTAQKARENAESFGPITVFAVFKGEQVNQL